MENKVFEYELFQWNYRDEKSFLQYINSLGGQGWEIMFIDFRDIFMIKFYAKRELVLKMSEEKISENKLQDDSQK